MKYTDRCVESGALLFKLSELHGIFVSHLQSVDIHKAINETRLKEQILQRLPEVLEQFDEWNTVLIIESGMRTMLRVVIKKTR